MQTGAQLRANKQDAPVKEVFRRRFTAAEVKTLNAVATTLVPGRAGYAIVPILARFQRGAGAGAPGGGGVALEIQVGGESALQGSPAFVEGAVAAYEMALDPQLSGPNAGAAMGIAIAAAMGATNFILEVEVEFEVFTVSPDLP